MLNGPVKNKVESKSISSCKKITAKSHLVVSLFVKIKDVLLLSTVKCIFRHDMIGRVIRNVQCLKVVNENPNDNQVVFIDPYELIQSEFYLVTNTLET